MGWYLRKSVKMGPVRWNLSRSGIGMSVGVKGLRVGTGPRGSYIAGGRGGLYFRQNLHHRQAKPTHEQVTFASSQPMQVNYTPAANFVTPIQPLPETNIDQFTPATFDQLASYVNSQRSNTAFFPFALFALIILNFLFIAVFPLLLLFTIPASIYVAYILRQYDRKKTHVALNYELGPEDRQNYEHLCSGFTALAHIQRLRQVIGFQHHGDWKQNAGAGKSAYFQPVRLLPPGSISWLETNIPIWGLEWNNRQVRLMFLPDRVLVEQGRRVVTLNYQYLLLSSNFGEFMEAGYSPADARIIRYVWHYLNKNGTPDHRYRNNYQIPVTEATYLNFHSNTGLHLSLQASNRQNAEYFLYCLRSFKPFMITNTIP